jgi:hypothetical protein
LVTKLKKEKSRENYDKRYSKKMNSPSLIFTAHTRKTRHFFIKEVDKREREERSWCRD